MYKRVLAITSLLLLSLSLSALDLDEATTIIEEASKATEGLQSQFEMLNEDNASITTVVAEENMSKTVEIIPQEVIEVEEVNETIKKAVTAEERNETIHNTPIPIPVNTPSIEVSPIEVETAKVNREKETTPTKVEEEVVVEINTITKDTNQSTIGNEERVQVINKEETTDDNVSKEEHDEIEGSVMKGLVIFKTRLKVPCGMTGEEFAKNYSQEDWDDIYDSKEFKKVVIEICPKMEGLYQERWTPHLYQFSLKYASDSDEIPEC